MRPVAAAGLLLSTASVVLSAIAGCGASPEQPRFEAKARKHTPVPVCAVQLAPPRSTRGGKAIVRSLDPEQWMSVLIPGFDPDKGLHPTDTDCTGAYAFANESLRGGVPITAWPQPFDPDRLETRAGPGGMRVLWLRALRFDNGDEGGLLAMVRAIDDRAEVYGIGSFRGPSTTQLSPARLGEDNLVVGEATICPDPDDCLRQAHFYLVRRGRLIQAATVDLERTAIVPSITERGLYARYRLATDVTYAPDGIHLLEQVKVKIIHSDQGERDSDRELRRVEFARLLRVERDTFFSTNDPLWERVVGQD